MAELVPTLARLLPAGIGSSLAGISCTPARVGSGPAICGTAAVTVKRNLCCITRVQLFKDDYINMYHIKCKKN